jgi:UDP-N-acetylmuramoyl-tripeptide--D-alanyl-D-alanine ligase
LLPENIDHKKIVFYGKEFGSAYKIENIVRKNDGFEFDLSYEGKKMLDIFYETVSEVSLYSVSIAVIVAKSLKIPEEKIKLILKDLNNFAGRMQKLAGKNGAIIIDDTYNASPESMKIALDTLYTYPRSRKIAILGMMNELGLNSESEHVKVGAYCDPKYLNLLVTIGAHANKFLAKKARENGCEVYEAKDAADAGHFVLDKLTNETVVLAKGSQNGVFTEESLKPLLRNQADFTKLVRQDLSWLSKKSIDF